MHSSRDAVAIVQARMGSTRLPGKALLKLAGKAVLEHVLERLLSCKNLCGVAVATSDHPDDNPIVELCRSISVRCERGSEENVLERYIDAADAIGAKIILRITGDNPLIDPEIVDSLAALLLDDPNLDYAYAVNAPLGTASEAVTLQALRRAGKESSLPEHREHVTLFIRERPQLFRVTEFRSELGSPDTRLTLDTQEDHQLLSAIFEELYSPGEVLSVRNVLHYLSEREHLLALNQSVRQHRPGNPLV
ncbi:MAG: glycosyltransferase family protein [Candidatus Coatesbacteria bacterium]|nr:glycosyltransferase family protein [Candidatus Coatesbacteria bacterium]